MAVAGSISEWLVAILNRMNSYGHSSPKLHTLGNVGMVYRFCQDGADYRDFHCVLHRETVLA